MPVHRQGTSYYGVDTLGTRHCKSWLQMSGDEDHSPLYLHLMLKNFSIPMSAPKPASVTTNPWFPTSLRAILSAKIDEFPWAMLANGPAWTKTGVPSVDVVQGHIRVTLWTKSLDAWLHNHRIQKCSIHTDMVQWSKNPGWEDYIIGGLPLPQIKSCKKYN